MRIREKDLNKEDSPVLSIAFDDKKNKMLKKRSPWDKKCPDLNRQQLKRFLISKIGENWNTVYSELCHRFDKRTFTGHFSMSEINKMVELNAYIDKDKISRRRCGYIVELKNLELYVGPKDNILYQYIKKIQKKKYKSEDIEAIYFCDEHNKRLIKENKIWFFIDENIIRKVLYTSGFSIHYSRLEGCVKDCDDYYGHLPLKRQLNKKELSLLEGILAEAENVFVPRKKINGDKYLYVNKLRHIIGAAKREKREK
jgi:hypothetical protein